MLSRNIAYKWKTRGHAINLGEAIPETIPGKGHQKEPALIG